MGMTVGELSEETGVDRRTIYRDLAAIEEAGYPLYPEKSGREVVYRFMKSMKDIQPISFTLEELFSLYILRASAGILEGTPFHEGSRHSSGRSTLPSPPGSPPMWSGYPPSPFSSRRENGNTKAVKRSS